MPDRLLHRLHRMRGMHSRAGTRRARPPAARAVLGTSFLVFLASCACLIQSAAGAAGNAFGGAGPASKAEAARAEQGGAPQAIVRASPQVGGYVAFPDICRAR